MLELSEYVPVNLISLGLLGALLLRRLVRMERFLLPRVVILTVLLWVPVFYLFMLSWPGVFERDCEPVEGVRVFCYAEM
jgi:hypothetical protein